ncbi:MAG: outer membrane lipoprotein-sorting protein [Verrucomicrobia bacterium]|nr:outer membrane lipoprotein-sorting protein [Verrucomicrobiota bacterium]MBV9659222.1 outer membrane lipoprotein-sorting protein [Verrucomicrobiota bacterium]
MKPNAFSWRILATAACLAALAPAAPFASTAARAAEAAQPNNLNAADILRAVREAQAGKRQTLRGQLRTSDGKIFPFLLTSDGPRIRYQFQPPAPAETVQVRLNDENSQLEEISNGGNSERLTPANFDKKVLGTDLAYEDLALRFLYWSRARISDEETIKTRRAWKLRLDAPGRRSQYSTVLLWVDKESGALLRAEGYDEAGQLVKKFEVVSAQKIDGAWYLKQMRIETVDPANDGRVKSRTYLEIKDVVR